MKEKLYLAYGSNLNIVQMIIRCPDAKFYGTAEIKDYELLFKGSKTGALNGEKALTFLWAYGRSRSATLAP